MTREEKIKKVGNILIDGISGTLNRATRIVDALEEEPHDDLEPGDLCVLTNKNRLFFSMYDPVTKLPLFTDKYENVGKCTHGWPLFGTVDYRKLDVWDMVPIEINRVNYLNDFGDVIRRLYRPEGR